ncbi:MAG: SPFH domain-containing protein [Planctomycetota bacterium]
MKADYLTFQRATGRSLIGAVLQGAMALALLIYGVKGRDHAAITAACSVGLGVSIWIGLAIVFDQQRRERVEALEQDTLAAQQGSSVFEGGGGDFRVAARRLAMMQRYFLPILSLVFGTAMIGVGAMRFSSGYKLVDPGDFMPVHQRGWALSVAFLCSLVGFVFARYTAAMAKQQVWSSLRAGAGQAIAASLMGLVMVTGHFFDIWGPDGVLRYAQVIFPVMMMVLGAEVYLNFLLDLYRPRKAGEVRTPPSDSRLMSFFAAPDRVAQSINEAINYQFGYEVSSTWLYQIVSRSVLWLVGVGVLTMWLLTCVAVLQPDQRGLLLRNGSVAGEVGPGWTWKLPWPIDQVDVPAYVERDEKGFVRELARTSTGVRSLQIATPPPSNDKPGPILWTNDHTVGEVYFLVRPSPVVDVVARSSGEPGAQDSEWLKDVSLIAMEVPLRYAVKDTQQFEMLGEPGQREEILKAVAKRAVMRALRDYTIDDMLGPRRPELVGQLSRAVTAAFEARKAGVLVLSVNVSGVHPSQKVAPSFEKIVQAQQGAEGLVELARAIATQTLTSMTGSEELAQKIAQAIVEKETIAQGNAANDQARALDARISDLLSQCGGTVAQTLAGAQGARWTKHMGERARAVRYLGQIASFEANEDLFRAHTYYDALLSAMRESRLIITDDSVGTLRFDMDVKDKDTGVANFSELSTDPK